MPELDSKKTPRGTPRRNIISFTLFGMVAGLAAALEFFVLSPKTYESVTGVWVKPDPFRQYRSYFSPAFEAGPLRAKTLKEVVQSLELDQHWDTSLEEAVDKLRENISVEETNDSGSYEIRVHSPDPDQARTIASQLAIASVNRHNKEEETRREHQLEALDAEIEDQNLKVARKKETLDTLTAAQLDTSTDSSEIKEAQLDFDRSSSLLSELKMMHVTERKALNEPLEPAARISSEPEVSTKQVSPNLNLCLLIGGLLGSASGLALARHSTAGRQIEGNKD